MAKDKREKTQTKTTERQKREESRQRRVKKRYSLLLLLLGGASLVALPLFAWLSTEGLLDDESTGTSAAHPVERAKQFGVHHSVDSKSVHSKNRRDKLTHDQRVNRLLQTLDNKIELETAKIEVENHRYAPGVNPDQARYDLKKQTKDSIAFGVIEQPAPEHYGVEKAEYERTLVLDDEINEKLWNEQVEDNEYDQARKKYVEQFIENARRAGYAVSLDKDFRIRKVRKIRRTY